jgi:hypothetical protein
MGSGKAYRTLAGSNRGADPVHNLGRRLWAEPQPAEGLGVAARGSEDSPECGIPSAHGFIRPVAPTHGVRLWPR